MKGWVVIIEKREEADYDLKAWVQKGVEYSLSLPAN